LRACCREKCSFCADPRIVVRVGVQPDRALSVERCERTFDAQVACTGEADKMRCVATLAEVTAGSVP
jgi:hypothetical protein